MLTEVADVVAFGLMPSERAYSAVRDASACVVCEAPELDRRASVAATLDWLTHYEPQTASALRELLESVDGSEVPLAGRWEDFRSRAAADSRLDPIYPWPSEWTDAILGEIAGTDLEAIAVEELLFPVCGRCFNDDFAPANAASVLRAGYARFKFEGNDGVAAVQPVWSAIERIATVIATAELLRSA